MRGHLLLLWVREQEEGQLQEAFLLNSTGEIYTSCRIFSTGLLYPHDETAPGQKKKRAGEAGGRQRAVASGLRVAATT